VLRVTDVTDPRSGQSQRDCGLQTKVVAIIARDGPNENGRNSVAVGTVCGR